ncbi:MAG: HD domain-containing protein [Clostridia bacterium]|nr:HD domain-containing protein [Clostridia bacterium]
MTQTEIQALWDYALSCCADVSHGEGHLRRVLAGSLKLADHYPAADRDVLMAAAILHDCAQGEQRRDPRVHHAAEGAKKAQAFLLRQGCDPAFSQRVFDVIAAHSSPVMASDAGLEAQLLFDADKLDMCGAVGLSRALMYALDMGEALYSAQGESFFSVAGADCEFVEKNLFTSEARRMADKRLRLSREFLLHLKDETNTE